MTHEDHTVEELVTRHAYGESVTSEEDLTLKAHLLECPSCAEFVSFVRKSRAVAATDASLGSNRSGCLSTEQLRKVKDLKTADGEKLRDHILNCKWCRAEYLQFSSMVNEEIPDFVFSPEQVEPNETRTDAEDHSAASRIELLSALQCSQRLAELTRKSVLTEAEKLEEVRLKKRKLRLKDQMEALKQQRSKGKTG